MIWRWATAQGGVLISSIGVAGGFAVIVIRNAGLRKM